MKTLLLIMAVIAAVLFVPVPQAEAQSGIAPSPFVPDLAVGASRFNLDSKTTEAFQDVAVGALYRWNKYDAVNAEWTYDIAIGVHVVYGYDGSQSKFAVMAGPSIFNGWLRVEPGYDFVREEGFVMLSTSIGLQILGDGS